MGSRVGRENRKIPPALNAFSASYTFLATVHEMWNAWSKSIDSTRELGRIVRRHSRGFDRQQDDLRNAPEPSLAINAVNGYLFCNGSQSKDKQVRAHSTSAKCQRCRIPRPYEPIPETGLPHCPRVHWLSLAVCDLGSGIGMKCYPEFRYAAPSASSRAVGNPPWPNLSPSTIGTVDRSRILQVAEWLFPEPCPFI